MPYNPDIHHRRSIRLPDYDYAQGGAYFVTVCAYRRECLFGDVVEDRVVLSAFGHLAAAYWLWLEQRYS